MVVFTYVSEQCRVQNPLLLQEPRLDEASRGVQSQTYHVLHPKHTEAIFYLENTQKMAVMRGAQVDCRRFFLEGFSWRNFFILPT